MATNGVRQFTLLNDNEFWKILQSANALHVTARAKYLALFNVLKGRGVAFKDIRKHLMNQAKDAGLYQKTYFPTQGGDKTYPPKSSLKGTAWFVALSNFMNWINQNYVSYEKKKVQKATPKAPTASSKTTVVRKKDSEGNVISETTTETTELTEPIASDITVAQTQAIIFQNLSLLGAKAKELGALEEFNSLMVKMSLTEEVIG